MRVLRQPITADEFNSGNPPKAAPSPDFSALASTPKQIKVEVQSRIYKTSIRKLIARRSASDNCLLGQNLPTLISSEQNNNLRSKGIDVLKLDVPSLFLKLSPKLGLYPEAALTQSRRPKTKTIGTLKRNGNYGNSYRTNETTSK